MKKEILCFLILGMTLSLTSCEGVTEKKPQVEKEESLRENAETEEEVKESSINAKKLTYKIYTGETVNISKKDRKVKYQSEDQKVAKVFKDGTVLGIKDGKTSISVSDGKQVSQIKIVVRKQGMVYPKFQMMVGEHLDLQFSNATVVSDWVSDKPEIASVTKDGMVSAKKEGKTIIHGTDGKRTYTCRLTVAKKPAHIIYLTFDDGPTRYTTPKVLDILKKNHVKATFFEIKPETEDFDLTRRVIDEGHTLALHGYEHRYDLIYRSVEIYKENLDLLQAFFFKNFGVWCTNTRFPGGSSNRVSSYNPGVMTEITKRIHDWGYHYFDWNVASGDSDGIATSGALYDHVIKQLSKERDNVILMHDYTDNDVMLGALEEIIAYGKQNGYTFLPITASTEEVHHTVKN
ncbi:MAG: polysaccharide deacetylase family protein [Lachnospiraceae bacterium]|nr:polysaccharide deacetylase family protein [Lachnospiraceae bacterium]